MFILGFGFFDTEFSDPNQIQLIFYKHLMVNYLIEGKKVFLVAEYWVFHNPAYIYLGVG